MTKHHLIYLTLCSLAQAAYISRMAIISNSPSLSPNRIRPTAFRPGVVMRPWTHQRLVQSASHRVPYVFYRNSPHRYTMKHYSPTRMVTTNSWKAATRAPSATSAEFDFVRAAASHAHAGAADGAIHTIPAPNLSLAEKPIVVLEDSNAGSHSASSESPKVVYTTTTEKYPNLQAKIEQPIGFSKSNSLTPSELQSLVRNGAALQFASEYGLSAIQLPRNHILHHHHHILPQQFAPQPNRIQHNAATQQNHIQPNGGTQQNLIQLNGQPDFLQHNVAAHANLLQHNFAPQNLLTQSILPQQFTLQNFHNLPNPQDIMQVGPEGIVISPNALYQPDPAFLQKLQNQLLQRFPGVEFVPYATELQTAPVPAPVPQPAQAQSQIQPQIVQQPNQLVTAQPETQTPIFLLQNEQITRQTPSSFVTAESQNQKNVYHRETQEATVVNLVPQVVTNMSENKVEVSSLSTPQNVTIELVAAESKPDTTTVKYVIETTTDDHRSTPIYYAVTQNNHNQADTTGNVQIAEASQIIQNVIKSNQNPSTTAAVTQNIDNAPGTESSGTVVTDGFYSAIKAAAAALVQVGQPQESGVVQDNNITTTTNVPTSTINEDLKAYFMQQETSNQNNTNSVTEIKPVLGVPFAKAQNSVNTYTLLRSDDKQTKVAKDGSVYAGQIVEASVTEDREFNKQKANMLTRRPPIRLMALTEHKDASTTTQRAPQKGNVVKARIPPKSKLTFDDKTGEPVLRIYASYVDSPAQKEALTTRLSNIKAKDIPPRSKDSATKWKEATVKALAKPHGFEPSENQVTQFGLKLKSRSDGYVPLFEDYEE